MTKQELMQKWGDLSRPLKNDIDAVIKYEISKSKEPQPALNPIERAYERGEKIRKKNWAEKDWIKKISETESIDEIGDIWGSDYWDFKTKPEKWELYTEPKQVSELTEQPIKPFEIDRFERLFCAVVASGHNDDFDADINDAKYLLEKLDSYYILINKKKSL